MEVICIEDAAFFALINKVVDRLKEKTSAAVKNDKWISGTEAMSMLRIKSKTTLQKLRDEGKIRFTQPEKKIVPYDRNEKSEHIKAIKASKQQCERLIKEMEHAKQRQNHNKRDEW